MIHCIHCYCLLPEGTDLHIEMGIGLKNSLDGSLSSNSARRESTPLNSLETKRLRTKTVTLSLSLIVKCPAIMR